jgi:hypothetical protein
MVQIPYAAIGLGVAAFLGVWAFIEAETVRSRAIIAAAAAAILLLPTVWHSPAGYIIRLIATMVFGIGCIVFLRWHGYRIR